MKYLLTILLGIVIIGCAETIQIKSDTRWRAEINQNVIEGDGDMYINLPNGKVHVLIEKKTHYGYIELRLNDNIMNSESFMTRQPYGKIEMDL